MFSVADKSFPQFSIEWEISSADEGRCPVGAPAGVARRRSHLVFATVGPSPGDNHHHD
jgi:hypothetical protein